MMRLGGALASTELATVGGGGEELRPQPLKVRTVDVRMAVPQPLRRWHAAAPEVGSDRARAQ